MKLLLTIALSILFTSVVSDPEKSKSESTFSNADKSEAVEASKINPLVEGNHDVHDHSKASTKVGNKDQRDKRHNNGGIVVAVAIKEVGGGGYGAYGGGGGGGHHGHGRKGKGFGGGGGYGGYGGGGGGFGGYGGGGGNYGSYGGYGGGGGNYGGSYGGYGGSGGGAYGGYGGYGR